MALIERLMDLEEPKIPVHTFFAACSEIVAGRATVQNVKTFFEMNTATAAEFDALIATGPTGTTALAMANKALFINSIHAIFILAEADVPSYDTPAGVRSKLGI
jgi:hypothetical protein